jgi:hypothetical protein
MFKFAIRKNLCAALLFFSCSAWSQVETLNQKKCHSPYQIGDRCQRPGLVLHPAQGALGFEEVRRKTAEIAAMSDSEREEYRKRKRVPVVVGPDQKLYMIDHHHSTLALLNSGFSDVYIEVIDDLSRFTELEIFWKEMIQRGWCYAFGSKGQPINPLTIAPVVTALEDDVYRSLSGIVREMGGYEKQDIPFEEFVWGNRFRAVDVLPARPELSPEDYHRAALDILALIRWGFWREPKVCAERLRRYLRLIEE